MNLLLLSGHYLVIRLIILVFLKFNEMQNELSRELMLLTKKLRAMNKDYVRLLIRGFQQTI